MFGLRSARGRAILAGTVFVLLVVGMGALAVWRARADEQLHETLGHTSTAATALEGAQAGFWQTQGALSALVISGDLAFVDDYDGALAAAEQNLAKARTEFLAMGKADEVSALDALTNRIGQFNESVRPLFPVIIEGDRQAVIELANTRMGELTATNTAIIADLEGMAQGAEQKESSERAAADRAAGVTLLLLVSLSGVALATGVGTAVTLVGSVVRPLAALRASARAITLGRPQARAKVSGPEEVASLARDFNEMTDALSAKTEALQESESRYRLIAENARDIIWTTDMNLRYTYVSPSFARMRGYSAEEAMTKTIRDTLTPASLELAAKVLAEELAIEKMEQKDLNRSRTLELEIKNKDGSTVWTEVKVAFLRDPDDRPVGLLGVSRDIAERKRAEEELRESEERFRLLFENAKDAIFHADPGTGLITKCNRAAETLLEKDQEEIIGQPQTTIHPPQKAEHYTQMFKHHLEEQGFAEDEAEVMTKSGKTKPVLITASVVSVRGIPIIQGVFRDITERKRAEEALRESEERARLIIETAHDALISMDASGAITAWNAQAEKTFGWSAAEAIGRTLAETIIPPRHHQAHTRGLNHFLATGEGPVLNKSVEITALHRDGHEFPAELAVWVVGSGETSTFNAFVRDITERKRAEQERERLHAELEVRAITDGLTGLYNHAHFFQRLAEEMERSKRYDSGFAVVMMDVDNFKRFNDSRGHQMGDEMLRLVADAIRSGLRRSDLAFRYGGDEFAAILVHADAARARAAIDRINRRLAKSLKQMDDGAAARVSLSAGVACFPDDGRTPDELVRVADAVLYSAKWAAQTRHVVGGEYAIESLAPPPAMAAKAMPSTAASCLAAALRELGVPDALAELNLRTVTALGTLAEIKDPYIRGHQERTSNEAATLAEEMGLSPDRVRGTRLAGLLHDLGKAGISKRILNKPGKLTEEEFAEIKEHPPLGSMMIISEIEALQQVVPIVRHHHEHFDSKGYPDGLAGEEIPLEARILAVVDAFDAMTHERSYRKALSREEALAELQRCAGTQFDPAVVEAFLALATTEGAEPEARKLPTSEDKELSAVRTTKT